MTITTAATTTPPPLPFFYEPYSSFACIASKREDNRIMGLLTQLSDVTPLCVKINTIFTQMLENKRTFVSRTIQYLHRCLKTKDLCVDNNTIFTQMLENKRPFVQDKRIIMMNYHLHNYDVINA